MSKERLEFTHFTISKEEYKQLKKQSKRVHELEIEIKHMKQTGTTNYLAYQEKLTQMEELEENNVALLEALRFQDIELVKENKRYHKALKLLNKTASEDLKTFIGTDSRYVIDVTSEALENDSDE